MGRLVNKRELSELLDTSERTFTDWQKEGMPIHQAGEQRGLENQYDVAIVVRWMIQRELAKAQVRSPRDELDVVKTERERLALAKDRRELVARGDMRPLLERYVQDVVAIIEGVPEKYAQLLQQTPDTEGKHQLLKEAMREVREGLGNYEFCTEPAAGGDPGISPSS
jgi:phage terminase Nu1 subunit (DNA packaging protein)